MVDGQRRPGRGEHTVVEPVRLSRRVRRVWLGILGLAAAMGAWLALTLIPPESTSEGSDFGQEYLLARAILDGVDPYQPVEDLAARYVTATGYFLKTHPTPHPPTVGLMALPLGLVSYPVAARIWFCLELVCLVGSVSLLVCGAKLQLPARIAPLLALALVVWPPVALEIRLGQLMLPILLALAAAQLALLSGRPAIGGGLWGLTLLIKPIAWPWLIVLIWRRERRALFGAAVVVGVGAALSVIAIGAERSANYVQVLLPGVTAAFLMEPTNLSLWTVAPRLGYVALSALLPAAVLAASVWWCCRQASLRGSLAMMTVASLVVSPIAWYFYLVLALLPLSHVLALVVRRGFRPAHAAVALGVCGLLSVSQGRLQDLVNGGASAGLFLVPALALALLGALLAWLTDEHALFRHT